MFHVTQGMPLSKEVGDKPKFVQIPKSWNAENAMSSSSSGSQNAVDGFPEPAFDLIPAWDALDRHV